MNLQAGDICRTPFEPSGLVQVTDPAWGGWVVVKCIEPHLAKLCVEDRLLYLPGELRPGPWRINHE